MLSSSNPHKYRHSKRPPKKVDGLFDGRSVGIRTPGLLDPNQARYQASPHPVNSGIIMNYFPIVKCQPPLFPPVRIFITPRSYTLPR